VSSANVHTESSGPDGPKRRIGLVGPILPFRGGVAQHTTRLHRSLRERATITTLSFQRLYPKWLFPGASERDADHEGHAEPGVSYVLDPLNPFTWRAAVRRFVAADVEGVIFPWWTVYFSPCFASVTRMLAWRDIPTVFLCHNVVDHEAAAYKHLLSRLVLAGAHGYLTQSRGEAEQLTRLLAGARVVVRQLPLYDHFPAPTGALPRQAPLELLFFGFVRPYKGVDVLLEAMAGLSRTDVHLTVVGEFWQDPQPVLNRIAALGLSGRVDVVPRFVSEQEAAEYFGRADVVIAPYRYATGSAIVAMAYHYDKPVIASCTGGLTDAVRDGITGYHVEPGSPKALMAAIARVTHADLEAMRPNIRAFKAELSWEELAEALLSLFEWVRPD
jgi:glycosyltransferase involved in cell wall biosynthesis